MSPEARREFPCSPRSPAAARQFVAWMLDLWDVDAPEAVALLLTSELVTNAVRFALAPFEVCLQVDIGILRLEVRDRNDGTPQVQHPSPLEPRGRGLWLVEQLATRWGAQPDGPGKVVWCELAW